MPTGQQGSLKETPLPELLSQLQHQRAGGLLELTYPDPALSTSVTLFQGRVGAIRSPFVPAWGRSLARAGLSRAALERARADAADVVEFLAVLQARGDLSETLKRRVLRHRLVAGLMPIFDRRDGTYRLQPLPGVVPAFGYVAPGERATSLSVEILHRLDTLRDSGANTYPHDATFTVLDAAALGASLSLEEQKLLAVVSEGLPLWEVARRTQRDWDDLTRTLAALEHRGLIGQYDGRDHGSGRHRRARLAVGELAPPFVLPGLDGELVSLGRYRGKRLLLRFGRHAGCPLCSVRMQQFLDAWPEFRRAKVEIVTIFGSPLEQVRRRMGGLQPPFPVLADPDDRVYALYGVGRSLVGLLHPNNARLSSGSALGHAAAAAADGELTRMPAEFLIGPDLRVERAHYYAYASDFLPIDEILAWGEPLEQVMTWVDSLPAVPAVGD